MLLTDIRSTFIQYFQRQGHEPVSSSSLIPSNDPSLMFTNSGMVQFKDVFLGKDVRPYSRAVTAQKCVRAGGKHNDLENVGYTRRHHTFFEMLGNFSFANYFKEDAIAFAYELLTKDFALPLSRLYFTVYHNDDEAYALWKKLTGFGDDRIIRIPTSDNFWSMGDSGPCGPCSEIFFDYGPSVAGGPPGSADADGDRFVEVWNLVFMQFNKTAGSEHLDPLPKPCVDTGMGLERIASVLQGKTDNFDIDLFRNIIEQSAHLSQVDADGIHKVSHRVIADHLRSGSFLIADGVLPSNEGRGYVLRRILRRAMRHAHKIGVKDAYIYRLLPTLVQVMGSAYPELKAQEDFIAQTLKGEEDRFLQTLDHGMKILDQQVQNLGSGSKLPGEVAFTLYDTYGFPLDLTQDVLRSLNKEVDIAGFDAAMHKQKEQSRAAWKGTGDASLSKLYYDLAARLPASSFVGYDQVMTSSQVLALMVDGQEVQQALPGQHAQVILDCTPFYATSGGQIFDLGSLGDSQVLSCEKALGTLFVHEVSVGGDGLKVGQSYTAQVDVQRRGQISAHHSAAHLLHESLRQVLGTHVQQKGSYVGPDRLRFDISHPKALSAEELSKVQSLVLAEIAESSSVETKVMKIDEAKSLGAMALFGEKYGDEVRVVFMGSQGEGKRFSVELCGGVHVANTGEIGGFQILSDEALASGVRRIEAKVGSALLNHLLIYQEQVTVMARLFKCSDSEVLDRVQKLSHDRQQLEKDLDRLKTQFASVLGRAQERMVPIPGNKALLVYRVIDGLAAKDLRSQCDEILTAHGSCIGVVVGQDLGKVSLAVTVSDDLLNSFQAPVLVQNLAQALGGKGGGGKAGFAQAGALHFNQAEQAILALVQSLA